MTLLTVHSYSTGKCYTKDCTNPRPVMVVSYHLGPEDDTIWSRRACAPCVGNLLQHVIAHT